MLTETFAQLRYQPTRQQPLASAIVHPIEFTLSGKNVDIPVHLQKSFKSKCPNKYFYKLHGNSLVCLNETEKKHILCKLRDYFSHIFFRLLWLIYIVV